MIMSKSSMAIGICRIQSNYSILVYYIYIE